MVTNMLHLLSTKIPTSHQMLRNDMSVKKNMILYVSELVLSHVDENLKYLFHSPGVSSSFSWTHSSLIQQTSWIFEPLPTSPEVTLEEKSPPDGLKSPSTDLWKNQNIHRLLIPFKMWSGFKSFGCYNRKSTRRSHIMRFPHLHNVDDIVVDTNRFFSLA